MGIVGGRGDACLWVFEADVGMRVYGYCRRTWGACLWVFEADVGVRV